MSVPANRMKNMDKFMRNTVDDKYGVDCVDGGGQYQSVDGEKEAPAEDSIRIPPNLIPLREVEPKLLSLLWNIKVLKGIKSQYKSIKRELQPTSKY